MLTKVKLALRITTTAFDAQLNDLIAAARADLILAGVSDDVVDMETSYPLVVQAIITYCKLHFGEPEDPVRLATSYNEQKAQLTTATGYTDWSVGNGQKHTNNAYL